MGGEFFVKIPTNFPIKVGELPRLWPDILKLFEIFQLGWDPSFEFFDFQVLIRFFQFSVFFSYKFLGIVVILSKFILGISKIPQQIFCVLLSLFAILFFVISYFFCDAGNRSFSFSVSLSSLAAFGSIFITFLFTFLISRGFYGVFFFLHVIYAYWSDIWCNCSLFMPWG